jgi:hypothetical protein
LRNLMNFSINQSKSCLFISLLLFKNNLLLNQ